MQQKFYELAAAQDFLPVAWMSKIVRAAVARSDVLVCLVCILTRSHGASLWELPLHPTRYGSLGTSVNYGFLARKTGITVRSGATRRNKARLKGD